MQNAHLPHHHGELSKSLELAMPKAQTFETVSDIFKMMSDSSRIQIFWLLCHCEQCVINISALLEMSSPAVSHHLKLLKTAGLVISRREGKEVYYTAAKTPNSQILHDMIEKTVEVACPSEECFAAHAVYNSQIQTVNDVREFLTTNLSRRYTIEELAQKFHINQTTLKSAFKTVFGKPLAAYMKEYRIKRAMKLLLGGSLSIAEIACEVGYENQSKFTKAFKDLTGQLPKDYRKLYSK
ncbi:MAG: metalloregulator ArsR/SmtB family transcription factor [Oscillospiraceae bacterium]|nr:metalloregulator ArsR/SmtB family transcription factor [Oscillospiraceae bacterium]